jgi:hypothetical protein
MAGAAPLVLAIRSGTAKRKCSGNTQTLCLTPSGARGAVRGAAAWGEVAQQGEIF